MTETGISVSVPTVALRPWGVKTAADVLRFDGVADARITDHGDLVLMDAGRCVVAAFAAGQWFSAYAFDEGEGSEDAGT